MGLGELNFILSDLVLNRSFARTLNKAEALQGRSGKDFCRAV